MKFQPNRPPFDEVGKIHGTSPARVTFWVRGGHLKSERKKKGQKENGQVEREARNQVLALCKKFPIYSFLEDKKGTNDEENTDFQIKKYSVRISGHLTSVSMESVFWDNLKNIAKQRNQSVNSLIASIDRARKGNLSSAIRVFVHRYWKRS